MASTVPPQLESEQPVPAETSAGLFSSGEAPARLVLPSLPESYRTVPFSSGLSWFRKILAFAGPGYLVAVGYMDPGNWATDIGGGSKFGHTHLIVVFISNLRAMFWLSVPGNFRISS